MVTEESLSALPTNFIKRVEQIINIYNSMGRGLIHGFQKDAIQNAVGARPTNSWKNWKCWLLMRLDLEIQISGMRLCF